MAIARSVEFIQCSDCSGGGESRGRLSGLSGSGGGNGGDCGGRCLHRKRCLRVKPAFAGGDKSPAKSICRKGGDYGGGVVVVMVDGLRPGIPLFAR